MARLDNAGYGIGSLASTTFATVPGLILLYYLTDTLAIPAAVAGVVVFIPKLFDVVLNPLVGRLSDRTRTRFGARRPWIVAGGVLFPLAFIATFWTPFSGGAAAIWVAVSFTLASMCFAAFVVPWSSLPAEIAPNSDARTSMAAWRIGFLGVAILLSGGLAPMLIESAPDARTGYKTMALTMGTIMMSATLVVALIGARRSTPATTRPAAPVGGYRASFAMLSTSAPLRAMFWLVALTEIAVGVSLASTPYVADYVLGDAEAVAPMLILMTIPLLLTMPLWRGLAVKCGKRATLTIALLVFAGGAFLIAGLSIAPEQLRHIIAFGAVAIMGIGFAGVSMLPQAMFSDALAYESARREESNTGAVVGAWNAAETISGGIGAAALAIALSLTGFISAEEGVHVEQPDLAIMGIVLSASLIPALAALVALLPVRGFTLAEQEVDRVTHAS